MLFNSWTFVFFFALVLPIYYKLPQRAQNVFLVLASYFFYSMWDWRFTFLLMISTVVDYFVALGIERAQSQTLRRRLLAISLVVNLGILGFFKYFNFFVSSAVDFVTRMGFEPNLTLFKVVLPVGISFYTFQTLAYTIDVYRGQQKPTRNFLNFALYVAYFPQLVAGPIERAKRLLPQIAAQRTVTAAMMASGTQLIFWGYVKKVAIGDSLNVFVGRIFSTPEPLETPMLWLGAYAFAVQVYCDFSGYTDIARGVSRLMGIELMENFKQPLLSPNITEFWRRWHVSLSSWLRDYVYLPLGGNRKGPVRTYFNLIATLTIGGLWHGANWTFILWGALNGVLISIHRFFKRGNSVPYSEKPRNLREWISWSLRVVFTFHLFAWGVILVPSPNMEFGWAYLVGLFSASPFGDAPSLALHQYSGIVEALVFYSGFIFVLDMICWWNDRDVPVGPKTAWWIAGPLFAAGLIVLAFVRETEVAPFFYFQF